MVEICPIIYNGKLGMKGVPVSQKSPCYFTKLIIAIGLDRCTYRCIILKPTE